MAINPWGALNGMTAASQGLTNPYAIAAFNSLGPLNSLGVPISSLPPSDVKNLGFAAPVDPITGMPYTPMDATGTNPVIGQWTSSDPGAQFIPDYSGAPPYGAPTANKPYYYYGSTPGQYYLDKNIPAGWTSQMLNDFAKSKGYDDYGRLAYVMSSFPDNPGNLPWALTPPDNRPSYWDYNSKSFVKYDPNDVNSMNIDPQAKSNLLAAKYGYSDIHGTGLPDYQRVLQTLQSAGWNAGMGYGPQDWAKLRAGAGITETPQQWDPSYLQDLLSTLAPNGVPNGAPVNTSSPWDDAWNTRGTPAPDNGDSQILTDAYVNQTLGGANYGGVVPRQFTTGNGMPPANPWDTLQEEGFTNPQNQGFGSSPWPGIWNGSQPGLGTAPTSQGRWGGGGSNQSFGASPWGGASSPWGQNPWPGVWG